MDATTRWETEALRSASVARSGPPKPSRSRARGRTPTDAEWVTLKEAERATGIPTNTLRKWVRRAGIASYLESDGELQVRMVDLGAVRERARALGRRLDPPPADPLVPATADAPRPSVAEQAPATGVGPVASEAAPAGTMIVPVDAWNKMLAQLGNLHEAGQQLAEARERAAKAETEAAFLRERLSEMRSGMGFEPRPGDATDVAADGGPGAATPHATDPSLDHDVVPVDARHASPSGRTTAYWRYLATGWRRRMGRVDRD